MDSRRLVRAPYRLASTLLLFASLCACERQDAPSAGARESQASEQAEGVRAAAVTQSSAALSAPGVLPVGHAGAGAGHAGAGAGHAEPTAASAAVAEDEAAEDEAAGERAAVEHGAGASTSVQSQPAPPVVVSKTGTTFDPPVKMEQIPDGAWVCDMGTVHYARLDKGDAICPLCKMDLVQKGAPKPAPAKPSPKSQGEHTH